MLVFCVYVYQALGFWLYAGALAILFGVAGFLILRGKNRKTVLIVGALLAFSLVVRIAVAGTISGDYNAFLKVWVETYRNTSISNALKVRTGDYAPLYNYFLIIFSRIPLNDLYLIKFLSTIFDVLSAWAVVLIVSHISKKEKSPLLFALILLFPLFILDTAVWAQCDSIYTFFGLMGFYFMLKKRSILAFVFWGLSFAFKLQAILIFPIILVALITKFLRWRDIWIIPVIFVVLNCLPLFFGRSFSDTLLIYVLQFKEYSFLGANVGIAFLFNPVAGTTVGQVVKYLLICLTAVWLVTTLFFIIRATTRKPITGEDFIFLTFYILLGTMLLMPKMHERFYYFTLLFGIMLVYLKRSRLNITYFTTVSVGVLISFIAFPLKLSLGNLFFNKNPYMYITVVIFVILISAVFIHLTVEFFKRYIHKSSSTEGEECAAA